MSPQAPTPRPAWAAPRVATRIAPASRWPSLDLGELWRYRRLVLLLAHRDLRVRYRQTLLGAAWAVLQPVATMVVFSLLFGMIARLPTDGLPYPVFYYSGLLPWMFVAHAVTAGTGALHEHSRILSRVYFPRLVLPLAPILSGLVDLAVACTVLFALMRWHGLWPAATLPALVFFVGLAALAAASVAVVLSAVNSRYKDVRFALQFGLQLWMFASPVIYPVSLVPEAWRALYALNPMVVVIQGFRWALTGQHYPGHAAVAAATAGLVLALGLAALLFRRVERHMADLL